MLLLLTQWLSQFETSFSVFQFLTLRAITSLLTALGLSLVLAPIFIRWIAYKQYGQMVREYGVKTHIQKQGTPTMGGLFILFAIVITTLLWADITNNYIQICLATIVSFGVVGFIDDWKKISHKTPEGISAKTKFILQSILAILAASALYLLAKGSEETTLYIPIFKDLVIQLGIFFIPVTWLCVVGSSNAVNITDGLDGLAIVPVILIASALAVFSYVTGNVVTANYLFVPHISGTGEVVIFCAAIAGSGLGFLWFNSHPAQVFMGDVGSLSLGASLGIIAIIVRQEIVYFIMSGIFVIEALSVIIQVASFKSTGKRVFLMAPIHHHFELKGWSESKVIVRFWIISLIFVAIGLATLKLR